MVEQKPSRIAVNRMPVPARPGQVAAAAALTPKEVWTILRRHILLIISLTALGFIIGGASWYLLLKYYPKYTAETYIRVLPPIDKDPMTIETGALSKPILYDHRVSIANLIKQQRTLLDLIASDEVRQTYWFKHFGRIDDVRVQKAFKDLRKHFGVNAQRDGDFVVLSMTCRNARESADIVNEMVRLFLASQTSTKRDEVGAKLTEFVDQRAIVQRELDSANKALDDIRTTTKLTDLKYRGQYRSTVEVKLDGLELEQNTLLLTIRQLQAGIANLEELAVGPINEQIEDQIESDPTTVLLTQQLATLEAQLAGALTRFGGNHREVRRLQELINTTRQKRQARRAEIAEQTRQANLKNAQDQLIVWTQRLDELEQLRQEVAANKRDLDLARALYEQREGTRDERKEMLDEIKQQIEKHRIMQRAPETSKVQFVGWAPEPIELSSPRWEFYFPGGIVLGLIFGVALAFLIELLNDLVRTPRDVARFLHIPLLGVIPDAAEDNQLQGIDLCHAVRQAPYSIISESYRRLRTNLKLSTSAQSSKALLITSGMAGDGKTSVAVNLATTFVAENKRVLLIDANFWRPSLHSVFPKPQAQEQSLEQFEFGLSILLAGRCGYQEAIRPTGIEGFDLIDSGPLPANPAELLGGPRMEQLVKQQRDSYDYVIVDGPPVLLVSEAKVLAKFVDGTVLVFNAAATRRGAALRTIRELNEVNAPIVGCVLFAVRAMKGGYFHEQFRSYQRYQKPQLARPI